MQCLDGKWVSTLGLVLVFGLAVVGCGDDDDSAADAGPDGGKTDGGGNAGKDGGSDGGGGSGGTTMSGGTGGLGSIPLPTCDTSITAKTKCGDNDCMMPSSQFASFVCVVTCCLPDDTCGTRRALMDGPTDCAAPATPDTSCPDYMGMGLGGGTGGASASDAGDAGALNLVGCCAASGKCGIISSIDMSCITSSPLLTDLMPGASCGEANDGGQDGG